MHAFALQAVDHGQHALLRSSLCRLTTSPAPAMAMKRLRHMQHRIVGCQTATRKALTSGNLPSSVVTTSKGLHSSAATEQSMVATGFEWVAASAAAARTVQQSIPQPSWGQLQTLFVASAIPMVGFGFMDNFIMIQAGGYIDATLGVKMGLATMTAAAMGQVISDVSGVVFGGTLERFVQSWNLVQTPTLTAAQRGLSICRNVSMAGSVAGVILGCFLGACSLMFVDLEYHERQKNASQLHDILLAMMSSSEDGDIALDCEACTVLLTEGTTADFAAYEPQPSNNASTSHYTAAIECLPESKSPQAKECAARKQVILSECGQALYVPVISTDGSNLRAVLEFRNKRSSAGFSSEDERTAKLLARHVAIFMDRLSE